MLVLGLTTVISIGATGFVLIEGYTPFEGIYMAVITITTVGFGEVHPLSDHGRMFVIGYLFVGLGVFTFGVLQLAEIVVRGRLRDWLAKRRMKAKLAALHDHFIVAGFGRMGRTVCEKLHSRGVSFIAVDRDEATRVECEERGWMCMQGDATDDRVLEQIGLVRARGLACVLANDADNLYVVLSARFMSTTIQIISRATDERATAKMRRAGANRVVSPYVTGGHHMAQLLINPNVEEFLEVMVSTGGEIDLAELTVKSDAPYCGQSVAQTYFLERGIVVAGVRRNDGSLLLPPPATRVLTAGDTLIAVGKADAIAEWVRSRA